MIDNMIEFSYDWYGKMPDGQAAFTNFLAKSNQLARMFSKSDIIRVELSDKSLIHYQINRDGSKETPIINVSVMTLDKRWYTETHRFIEVEDLCDADWYALILCAFNGIIIHECLHNIFTPFHKISDAVDQWRKSAVRDEQQLYAVFSHSKREFLFECTNVVEDIFIEISGAGLGEFCFGFLQNMRESLNGVDVFDLTVERINSCLYGLSQIVVEYNEEISEDQQESYKNKKKFYAGEYKRLRQLLLYICTFYTNPLMRDANVWDFTIPALNQGIGLNFAEVYKIISQINSDNSTQTRSDLAFLLFQLLWNDMFESDNENEDNQDYSDNDQTLQNVNDMQEGLQELFEEINRRLIVDTVFDGLGLSVWQVEPKAKALLKPSNEFAAFGRELKQITTRQITQSKTGYNSSGAKLVKSQLSQIWGDGLIFSGKSSAIGLTKGVEIFILCDCSGSMNHKGLIHKTLDAALGISKSLVNAQISFEVFGHTANTSDRYAERKLIKAFKQSEGNVMAEILKIVEYRENGAIPNNLEVLFSSVLSNIHMGGNADGFVITNMTNYMKAKRTKNRQVLLVLSDGLPSVANTDFGSKQELKSGIEYARKNQISVIGVALVPDVVDDIKHYYGNAYTVDCSLDLSGQLKRIVRKIIQE